MATYRQLTAQLARLETKIAKEREKAVAQAVAEIRAKIDEYDITPEELGFGAPQPKRAAVRKPASQPKYRHPKTGATWTGRGRAPAWLGKNRARFLIES